MFSRSHERLSKILNAHLGVRLQSLANIQGLDVDPELVIELADTRSGESMAFQFSDKPSLNQTEFNMMKELVRSFLEGVIEGDQELADLEQVSMHLEGLNLADKIDQSSDVFRLDSYRKNPYPFVWGNIDQDESAENQDDTLRAELMFGPAEAVYRKAFDAHVSSGRFAFININDLNPEVWSDVVVIRRLGNMTVFVPDITALTFAQQDIMLEILTAENDEETPYFIFASNSTLPELRRSYKVREKFLAVHK